MIQEGAEEFRIRYQKLLIDETTDTLQTCMPRIEDALMDLQNIVAIYEEKPGSSLNLLKLTSEWEQA